MTSKKELTPHPHALLLPALTDEEYAALKADIEQHGILYPIIVDENNQVLDGVHRLRIASELSIELPQVQHTGLSEDRKLHLAVGLNLRRRHLDADRRRELVRKLHKDNRLTMRKIANITGWSKSTVERDLKTSPFEQIIQGMEGTITGLNKDIKEMDDEAARRMIQVFTNSHQEGLDIYQYADSQWKRGNWPLPLIEQAQITMSLDAVFTGLKALCQVGLAVINDRKEDARRHKREFNAYANKQGRLYRRWERARDDPAKLERLAKEYADEHGLPDFLAEDAGDGGVPNGTPTVTSIGQCAYCGADFERERSTRKYCSDAHRQMAYRERRR